VDLRAFRRRTIYPLATAVIFLVSIPVAFVSSLLAMASWALVFVVSMVRVWDEHRRQARAGPGEP